MIYTSIASLANPHIKAIIDIRNKRSKYKHNAFLIEGPHLIEMAIGSGIEIIKVFFNDTFSVKKEAQKILKNLSKRTDQIYEVTEQILKKITDTETPQGIVALVSYKPLLLDDLSLKDRSILVVIDGIQDPGNLGTIIRTADAAGADAVIIMPGTCDAFMPKTIRATAGSLFNIPIVYAETADLITWLRQRKIKLAVTTADAERSVFDTALRCPIAFVFGNEAHGVSEQLRKSADLFLKIPIFGKAESLNVATSAAICLYEAVRRRRKINE